MIHQFWQSAQTYVRFCVIELWIQWLAYLFLTIQSINHDNAKCVWWEGNTWLIMISTNNKWTSTNRIWKNESLKNTKYFKLFLTSFKQHEFCNYFLNYLLSLSLWLQYYSQAINANNAFGLRIWALLCSECLGSIWGSIRTKYCDNWNVYWTVLAVISEFLVIGNERDYYFEIFQINNRFIVDGFCFW